MWSEDIRDLPRNPDRHRLPVIYWSGGNARDAEQEKRDGKDDREFRLHANFIGIPRSISQQYSPASISYIACAGAWRVVARGLSLVLSTSNRGTRITCAEVSWIYRLGIPYYFFFSAFTARSSARPISLGDRSSKVKVLVSCPLLHLLKSASICAASELVMANSPNLAARGS